MDSTFFFPLLLFTFAFLAIAFFVYSMHLKGKVDAFEDEEYTNKIKYDNKQMEVDRLNRALNDYLSEIKILKNENSHLTRKLEIQQAEHIISPNTTSSTIELMNDHKEKTNSYNGVSRYKMKKFISSHRTSNFASSIPKDSELDSMDIVNLYMYYTLLNNALGDDKDTTPTITTNADSSEPNTVIDYKENEPSFIDKAVDTVNDITSPITTPVMGVVNEAFDVRDKMIDTTFGTLNEINNAKNEAIMNAVTPVIDKAEEIKDSVIEGASKSVEQIKNDILELNHSVDDIESMYGSESSSTYEDYSSSKSDSSDDDYSSSSSSYSSSDSSSSYSDSSSDYSSSSSSSSYSSYDSDSSWSSSSSSWDSGSSSYDSGSCGGDW